MNTHAVERLSADDFACLLATGRAALPPHAC